jgi:hypothetical protein
MLSASMWVASMLSESTYSTLHECSHVLVDLCGSESPGC